MKFIRQDANCTLREENSSLGPYSPVVPHWKRNHLDTLEDKGVCAVADLKRAVPEAAFPLFPGIRGGLTD